MKLRCAIVLLWVCSCALSIRAQSIFERLPEEVQRLGSPLILYQTDAKTRFRPVGFGTASLYGVPIGTNETPMWVSVVTARHNLEEKPTKTLVAGILVKVTMPDSSSPRYLNIPLKHDNPKNYWVSPSGLDICVIPVPPEVIEGSNWRRFREDQIVTTNAWQCDNIRPGLIVQAICMQPEYLDPLDFVLPEVYPTIRVGHLSRIGFAKLPNGNVVTRPHVIDLHASPGNSGATVVIHVPRNKDGKSVSEPMFLGVIAGFREETNSYEPYKAPLSPTSQDCTLTLVSKEAGTTNTVALSIKTVANPNLTYVIPAFELGNLRESQDFLAATIIMGQNKARYEMLSILPAQTNAAQPPAGGDGKPAPQP